jgi:hypothetical protein
MKSLAKKLFGGFAALALTLVGLNAPAYSVDYAAPIAVVVQDVTPAKGGVFVTWDPVEGSPKVSHYIVSGGAGSCPIIVPGNKTSALLPVLSMKPVDVVVQAANEYGLSPYVAYGDPVAPKTKASSNL